MLQRAPQLFPITPAGGWPWLAAGCPPSCSCTPPPQHGEGKNRYVSLLQERESKIFILKSPSPHQHLQLLSFCHHSSPTFACLEQERAWQAPGRLGCLQPRGYPHLNGTRSWAAWAISRRWARGPQRWPQHSWEPVGRFRSRVRGSPVDPFLRGLCRDGEGTEGDRSPRPHPH